MANVSMNLGDELIFDADDVRTPSTTYLTNPASATEPDNTIEVWLNGAKQVEFRKTKVVLTHDLAFLGSTPKIACPQDLELALGQNGQVAELSITNTGTELFSVRPNRVLLSDLKLQFSSLDPANRIIETAQGDIEVAGTEDVILRVNSKSGYSSSKLRVYDYNTEVARMESAGATFLVNTTVSANLNVSGSTFVNGIVAGTATVGYGTFAQDATFQAGATFAGKVDANAEGIRTKTVTSVNPSGGSSGDVVVRTDTSRLFVNVNGTWKSVALS
ncbi:MAG: hypothetical protein CVU56_05320 [Deltaproteobacteria bacterium HGW-Deltaproteobacteria-14]|nr:MAG: hypothetical protein CVU56_05320 [Deltaproteobacteria bacterium HGW-Deltaproteobacteria-14]